MRVSPVFLLVGAWGLGCGSSGQDCGYRPGEVDSLIALVTVKLQRSRECAAILGWDMASEGGVTTVEARTTGTLDAIAVDLLDLGDPDPACDPLGPDVCGGWEESFLLDELGEDRWGIALRVSADAEAVQDGETTRFDTPEELAAATLRFDGMPPGAYFCAVGGADADAVIDAEPACTAVPQE